MTRHYTAPSFFRQTDNALLKRYFHARDLLLDFDFDALKPRKIDPLFEAWKALPDDEVKKTGAAFQEIFDMGCPKGFIAIVDEARYQMRENPKACDDIVAALSALDSHQNRAMTVYLDHRELWRGATKFFHADSLSYWRKRQNMDHSPARVHEPHRGEFARQIGHYFHKAEGRGANCKVEAFRRGNLDYFFAYPEDYANQIIEWQNGQLDRRPHTPAFEVVFLYDQAQGKLDLNYSGNTKAIEPLQDMFARVILGLAELPPDPKDGRVYDLTPLGNRDFVFAPCEGVERVVLHKLRLSAKVKGKIKARGGERIMLEADSGKGPQAIYDLLDQSAKAFPRRHYPITYAEMTAYVPTGDGKEKTIPIRLGHPNSCNLPYDDLGLKLRAMLADSGIEPRLPKDEA
ncbi:MAG TPA: hypothetical protein DDX54_06595 [Rhodospirillaceae bacterium]|jgi:hypothetical protein|nr:hypothetical protein [Alphaproteobacteria bacterium]HBH27051.1 hypothetical protein [Rhodospirillaceae bacterium]